MKKLIIVLVSVFGFAQFASADNFDVMQSLVDVPTDRYNQLSCHFDNSNRDLCAIEDRRIASAQSDLRFFDGSASEARFAVESNISSRSQRMSDLSCGFSRDNADICNYEAGALWEVEQLLNDIKRDRRRGDRDDRRPRRRR